MDKSLVQKLKWCRRELAALKIAHEQSLEGVNFFTATASQQITIGALFDTLHIYINYDESVVNAPFCQVYVDNPQFYSEAHLSFSDYYHYHHYYLNPYWVGSYTTDINVRAISTAEIKSITIEVRGWT